METLEQLSKQIRILRLIVTVCICFIVALIVSSIYQPASSNSNQDVINNQNVQIYNLKQHQAVSDENIRRLFKNDSLIIVHQASYQNSQNKREFFSDLFHIIF